MAKPVSPEVFREEASRRLIDTYNLMVALGLRSKESVRARVKAGALPPPVYTSTSSGSLWDRDAIPDTKEATG